MTVLLSSTAELKEYVPANVNLSFETIEPYVGNALSDYIETPWLGAAIIADLESNVATAGYEARIKLVRNALANFSLLEALPFIELQIGDAGITRNESEFAKTAYRGQIARLEAALLKNAYSALEKLLELFQSSAYALWTDAPGYVEYNRYIFTSARDFSKYYKLINGNLTFTSLVESLRYTQEFSIKKEIGRDQFNAFMAVKTIPTGTPALLEEALILCKSATAYLTLSHALREGSVHYTSNGVMYRIPKDDVVENKPADDVALSAAISSIYRTGVQYVNKLVELLNANLDDFPIFRDDASIIKTQTNTGDAGKIFIA